MRADVKILRMCILNWSEEKERGVVIARNIALYVDPLMRTTSISKALPSCKTEVSLRIAIRLLAPSCQNNVYYSWTVILCGTSEAMPQQCTLYCFTGLVKTRGY